jgi:acyl transferase domain-containing protein
MPQSATFVIPTNWESNSILANRVSWFYNFKGTSLTLDTACSSSLVAFHLAAQDLRNGQAEMVSRQTFLLLHSDRFRLS